MLSALAPLRAFILELRPRKGSFSGEVLQSFLTNLGATGLTVVSGILLARLLGPTGRGQLAAIQAMPLTVAAIGQLGLNEAVVYFGGRDRGRAGRYAVSAAALILLCGIPIVAVGAWLAGWVLAAHGVEVIAASQIFMLLLFVNAVDGVAITTARALHRISLWNAIRIVPGVLWVLLVAGFFLWGTADPARIALTYLAGYAVLAPVMVFAVRDHLRGHWLPVPRLWPQLLRFGLPVAAGVAPRLLNQRIDQLIVAAMLPPRELGYYAVAVGWTGLGQIPAMTITAVAFSKMSGMPALEERLEFLRKTLWVASAAAAVTAAGLAVVTPFAIRWVFGADFTAAVPLAWVMLVAVVVRSVAWMVQIGMQGIGRPSVGMYSQWTGLGLLLPAAALLIPRAGALGAALSLVVAAVASLAMAAALSGRAIRSAREAEAREREAPSPPGS